MAGADERSRPALSEADMAACVAYVDGDLGSEQRAAFELRLANEPALAAATEALFDTDRMLRTAEFGTEQRLERVRRLRPWAWAASIALAAALLFTLAAYLLAPRPSVTTFRVAVAPGFESSADFIAARRELTGLRPPGLDVLRGAPSEPNIGALEFAERARAAERALAGESLEAKSNTITAGFFVVPLELDDAADVVLYALPASGAAGAEFEPVFSGRLEAGRHVLPKERFQLDDVTGDRVRYERGVLVPVGAREVDVVVGVRGPGSFGAFAPRVRDAAYAEHELELAGFRIRRMRVREPD
jgi:hypothetical protein